MPVDFARGISVRGDSRKPALLFLHGIRLAGTIWEEHARALCDEFFVVTPDLPGHGALADLPFEAPVIDAFLAYVCGTLTAGPPLIIGYSLGGYVAMRYATAFPERTAGLLLTGCSTDIVGHRRMLYELSAKLTGLFPPPVLQGILSGFFRLTLPRTLAETIIPFPFDQRVFRASCELVGDVRYSERLERYGKPVLIVNGEWDLLFRPDEQRYARSARARTAVMRAATHIAPFSRTCEFVAIVRDFAHDVFAQTVPPRRDP